MIGPIDNDHMLLQTFGKIPSLDNSSVITLEFCELLYIKIRLLINETAKKMPPKWKQYNTLYVDFIIVDIRTLNISYRNSDADDGTSRIYFKAEDQGLRRIVIEGKMKMDCLFYSMRAQNFYPGMVRGPAAQ